MQESIKKTLEDSLQLYSLPQTLSEVLRVVSDDGSGADDLAKVLLRDPALTTRVLKVVNSPYYGAGRQIGTVSQAIVTMGMRQITALALSASVYGMTENWESVIDRVRFWRHSLEVAIAARAIADKIKRRNAEELFVSGLLHDIGLLILEKSFPEKFAAIWKQVCRGANLMELEEEAWGTNHARVGQFLLEQWRLPDSICEAVGRHHHVFPAGADDDDLINPQIINLANRVSHFRTAWGEDEIDTHSREERENVRGNIRLDPALLIEIEKNLFAQTLEESNYLEIEIGSSEEILTEANRMLFRQYAEVENLLDENRRMYKQIAGEQVKTGFLESLKSTAATFVDYLERATGSVMRKVYEVEKGIETGAISDPSGLVSHSAETIGQEMKALIVIMEEMKRLTQTESAMYYDQISAEAIETRIRQEIVKSADEVTV